MSHASSSDTSDSVDTYEVEYVVDSRPLDGKTEYFIKWKNYPSSQNTWEPEANIIDKNLISDFKLCKKKEKDEQRKRLEKMNSQAKREKELQHKKKFDIRKNSKSDSDLDSSDDENEVEVEKTCKSKKGKGRVVIFSSESSDSDEDRQKHPPTKPARRFEEGKHPQKKSKVDMDPSGTTKDRTPKSTAGTPSPKPIARNLVSVTPICTTLNKDKDGFLKPGTPRAMKPAEKPGTVKAMKPVEKAGAPKALKDIGMNGILGDTSRAPIPKKKKNSLPKETSLAANEKDVTPHPKEKSSNGDGNLVFGVSVPNSMLAESTKLLPNTLEKSGLGFRKGYELDFVIGVKQDVDGRCFFLVKWVEVQDGDDEVEFVPMGMVKDRHPQKVIEYYQNLLEFAPSSSSSDSSSTSSSDEEET